MSGKVANREDVLKEHAKLFRTGPYNSVDEWWRMADRLAAEIRELRRQRDAAAGVCDNCTELEMVVAELRKDRDRLDWLERHIEDDTPLLRWSDGSWSTSMFGPWSVCRATAREAIDAAMSQENTDGE